MRIVLLFTLAGVVTLLGIMTQNVYAAMGPMILLATLGLGHCIWQFMSVRKIKGSWDCGDVKDRRKGRRRTRRRSPVVSWTPRRLEDEDNYSI